MQILLPEDVPMSIPHTSYKILSEAEEREITLPLSGYFKKILKLLFFKKVKIGNIAVILK